MQYQVLFVQGLIIFNISVMGRYLAFNRGFRLFMIQVVISAIPDCKLIIVNVLYRKHAQFSKS